MNIDELLREDVQQFIADHEDTDVRQTALKKAPNPSWSYATILDQIKVRQKAKNKTPDLYETNGIIFPSSHIFEQASSSACAAYKASLVEGKNFVDLTAGCGVDAYYFSKKFSSGVLIEQNEDAVALIEHNMRVLRGSDTGVCVLDVLNESSNTSLQNIEKTDFIFIDPERRTSDKKGLYELKDCSPDVVSMLPVLKHKTKKMMVKLSPILDINNAIASLECVIEVHVVQWQNECKEVLYILDFEQEQCTQKDVKIFAVSLDDHGNVQQEFSYVTGEENSVDLTCADPGQYIYEPGPAFQKSGGFKSMALQFDVQKLHPHTHLYTSDKQDIDFPGKCYEVVDIVPVRAKSLPFKQADLAVRNFPESVKNLRKKLQLSEGGDHRVYATTLQNGDKRLIICKKP